MCLGAEFPLAVVDTRHPCPSKQSHHLIDVHDRGHAQATGAPGEAAGDDGSEEVDELAAPVTRPRR